jgi:hypothetical protein
MKYFFKICFLLFYFSSFSQGAWLPWEPLFKDDNIEVEVSFQINKNSCEEGGRYSKIKYKVTGEIRDYRYFINWKMDYVDCYGSLYYQINSLNIGEGSKIIEGQVDQFIYYPSDVEFTCSSLENHVYDVKSSPNESNGSGIKAYPLSKDPTSIKGNLETQMGDSTILSVNGGALGVGAQWVWYENNCGETPIGFGENITVHPLQTTTYFVRAETEKQKTKCATATVTVSQLSLAPNFIVGLVKVCKGESINIKVIGGRLGLDAEWVWYSDSCDGTEIGRGQSISVSPSENTTYYVRASGKLNNTTCVQKLISVYEKSVSPSSITSSKVQCANEQITLSEIGGILASDAKWVWYKESCGYGNSIGTGNIISVIPMQTKSYYVRAEGECNTTECAKIEISPDQISTAPGFVLSNKLERGKEELYIYSGTLGKEAEWRWFKDECGKGKVLGRGESITVRQYKPQIYFVRAEGICNVTECESYEVLAKKKDKPIIKSREKKQNPIKTKSPHKFGPTYNHYNINNYNNSFLHLGVGLGYDGMFFEAKFATSTKETHSSLPPVISTSNKFLHAIGVNGEFVFHPIIKDYFSLGLFANGAIGTITGVIPKGSISLKGTNYYTRVEVGAELAAGYSKVKGLVKYKSSFQTHQYKAIRYYDSYARTYTYIFNKSLRKEILSIGLRLAPYSTLNVTYKRAFCVDLVYNLSHDYEFGWHAFNGSHTSISNWQHGVGMSIWIQSILKLQVDYQLNSTLGSISNDINSPYLQFSLIYNRNFFY